jgi:hypothetical protein
LWKPLVSRLALFKVLAVILAAIDFCLLGRLIPKLLLPLESIKRSEKSITALALVSLALLPNAFFILTPFPYPFLIFFVCLYFLLFFRKEENRALQEDVRKEECGLFFLAVWIAMAYPSGILFAGIPGLMILRDQVRPWKARLFQCALTGWPFLLGNLIVCLIFYFQFDNFWLYFDQAKQYARTGANPLYVMLRCLRDGLISERLTLVWFLAALLMFVERRARLRIEVLIFLVVVLVFSPITGITMSLCRHYVLMFPIAILIGASRRPFFIKAIFMLLGFLISWQVLFPMYIRGALV